MIPLCDHVFCMIDDIFTPHLRIEKSNNFFYTYNILQSTNVTSLKQLFMLVVISAPLVGKANTSDIKSGCDFVHIVNYIALLTDTYLHNLFYV